MILTKPNVPVRAPSRKGAYFTNPPSVSGQITAGSTWHFSTWFRDPAAGGAFFDLSNGLTVTFQ